MQTKAPWSRHNGGCISPRTTRRSEPPMTTLWTHSTAWRIVRSQRCVGVFCTVTQAQSPLPPIVRRSAVPQLCCQRRTGTATITSCLTASPVSATSWQRAAGLAHAHSSLSFAVRRRPCPWNSLHSSMPSNWRRSCAVLLTSASTSSRATRGTRGSSQTSRTLAIFGKRSSRLTRANCPHSSSSVQGLHGHPAATISTRRNA
mmetsp:Transcript_20613/g.64843  ORF Transcript_20613/g.64843 Transcript_20613/m.64843 type:complete len:202 (+) Transcript_20613:7768-8373(+)